MPLKCCMLEQFQFMTFEERDENCEKRSDIPRNELSEIKVYSQGLFEPHHEKTRFLHIALQ